MLRQVDNLRSAVAKNAILTINDLFLGLNTVMDGEVLTIVSSVVKRCGDSSNFLGEVAENAILQMIDSVNSLRALHALLSNCEHRNSSIRGKVVGFMLVLLMRKGLELRGSCEFDTLRMKLSKLLGDSTPEARAGSRSIVKLLLEQGIYTKSELEQYISVDQINKSLKEQPPMYASDARGGSRYHYSLTYLLTHLLAHLLHIAYHRSVLAHHLLYPLAITAQQRAQHELHIEISRIFPLMNTQSTSQ